ncbi:MAG TPA: tail fiber domain-containing protein, partial [Bacteroidales bacterium]|nr:tail fiber domain-containing protein [Bacteroidales bacterium]
GTNNPAAKLHLNSLSSDPLGYPEILMTIDRSSNIYPFVKIGTDGAGGGNIDLYGDDNLDVSTRISADDNSYFNTYSGNVGIGTFTPTAKLDVAGTVRITGGSPGTGKVLTSDATGLASWTTPKAGTVTSITAGAPLTGGTITSSGTIGITQANSTTNGYLASNDWNTFNNKGTGSVTSVNSGTGLSGGPFTTSGTISMANMAANTIKGNNTAGLAAPTDISVSTNQVLGRIAGNITGIPIGTSSGNVAAGNHTHAVPGVDQQVIFNSSGALSGNSSFKWANNYKTIQLGNFPGYSPYNPWAGLPGLNIANYGNYNGGTTCGLANITMSSNLAFDNGRSNNIYLFRSRDETNAGGAAGRVIQGDCLGSIEWSGWNYLFQGFSMDWSHQWGAGIRVWVDGVVSDEIMPTSMSLGSTKDLVFNAGQLERMRILADGSVGIGTATPGAYKLYVAGNAWSTGTWGSSDERWKKDIAPITNALGKVSSLQGVTYKWRISEFPKNGFEEGTHYGLIAQQVEKVVPELVKTNTDGYKAVSYDKISALLIEAIKEQQKQIELLKKEISELKRQK